MRSVSRSRRHRPVALATLVLVACGGDPTRPSPTRPPSGSPVPGAPVPATPGSGTPAPSAPSAPTSSDAAPDSLFGAETGRIAAAVAAQRAALAAEANAALAGEGAPTPAGVAASGARLAGARLAAATALPLPIRYRNTQHEVQGQGDASVAVTTTKTLDASLEGTTLTVVSTERAEVRALAATDPTRPRPSTVTEARRELTLDACPDARGVAAGRWTSYDRTWFAGGGPELAGPDHHNRVEEVTAEGTVAAHVNDLAELRAYDLDVRIALRKMRVPGNRPMDRRGSARLRRTEVAPSRLIDHLNDAMLEDETGDFDLLRAVDVGLVPEYVALTQRVQAAYGRARQVWRRGDCVEVVPARGAAGGPLAPGATVSLGPEGRSRVDGTTVTPATLTAAPTAGTIAAPAADVPHPATFRFTMPARGGATVNFTATSRRGIGFGSVRFGEEGAAVGELVNDAAVAYAIAGTDQWDQTVGGTLEGTGRVRSAFRLRFDRRDPDGTLHYDVLAENHVAVRGQGELRGTHDGHAVTVRATLDGSGTTHNPVGPGDRPLEEGHTLAPDERLPSPDAGSARFWTRDGQHFYALDLHVMQIVPSFQWRREERADCIEGLGVATTLLDNLTRQVTVRVDDPHRCLGDPPEPYRLDLPYTFGMIASDWTAYDAVTGSNAMVTGRWDPRATGDITGTRSGTVAECAKVAAMDPTHLGAWALVHAGFPVELSFERQGSCRLTTALRWTIPVPPEARAAATR
jgi:hypothetical protein